MNVRGEEAGFERVSRVLPAIPGAPTDISGPCVLTEAWSNVVPSSVGSRSADATHNSNNNINTNHGSSNNHGLPGSVANTTATSTTTTITTSVAPYLASAERGIGNNSVGCSGGGAVHNDSGQDGSTHHQQYHQHHHHHSPPHRYSHSFGGGKEETKYCRSDTISERSMSSKGILFADVEEMKKAIGNALTKKVYNVHHFYKRTGVWQKIARSSIFENITLFVIMVNAAWMWIDTDMNKSESLLNAKPVFQIMEHMFCVYFSFEWFVRFSAFELKSKGFQDFWFCFDSCLVFMMVLETWVVTTFILITTGAGSSGASPVNASILRLFRLLRLSRLARMLRSMPELMILIKGMVSASRSVFFTLLLLFVLLYIFAIALTQLSAGNPVISSETGVNIFKTIPHSMYYLLISGVFLDNLGPVMTDIGTASPFFAVIFLFFIALAALMVMNMLIGVLCEVVSAVAATEKEDMLVTFVRDQMNKIIRELDQDSNGFLSMSEFKQLMVNETAVRALHEVGVDPVGLVDFADYIFDPESQGTTADSETGELQISFEKLMRVVLDFRGTNNSTVKDILNVTKLVKAEFRELKDNYLVGALLPTSLPSGHSIRGVSRKNSKIKLSSRSACQKTRSITSEEALVSHENSAEEASVIHQGSIGSAVGSGDLRVDSTTDFFGPSVTQRTQKVEAFLLAAQSELARLTNSNQRHASVSERHLQEWAHSLNLSLSDSMDTLRRLQDNDTGSPRPLSHPLV